jgi:cellulose synthase/poly-beta-1,6-N-acetylglucosamine synthase-like glycosyltransferase
VRGDGVLDVRTSVTAPPAAPASRLGPAASTDHRRQRRRQVLASAAFAIGLAYLTWRALFTLNPDALALSWFLWTLEAHAILGVGLAAFSLWDTRPLVPATDAVPDGRVAVLIATYDEPTEIVLPTVAAAVAMDGDHETWLLDDGVRPEMRELAERLGARYLGRESSEHAKAGNLNNALAHIDAEFVVVLDADHVPDRAFLRRTLPYFQDEGVALVQTPQDFYNEGSFEHVPSRRRLGSPYTEQSLFYRVIQPGKNRWRSAFWCGTNAAIRVSALREVGGVATDSITEDLMTTIRLHRAGWGTVYHDEVLARGLAAPTAEEYQLQRRRWCIGAIQTMRHERPLTGPDLSWQQRLSYAGTFLAWFESLRVLGLLIVPPLVLLTGTAPIVAPLGVFAIWFAVFFVTQFLAVSALGQGHLRPIRSAMFDLIRLQTTLKAIIVGLTGADLDFKVTPKGRSEERRIRLPGLLVAVVVLHVVALTWYLAVATGTVGSGFAVPGVAHGAAFWAVVNGYLLGLALHRIRARTYAAERRRSHRHRVEVDSRVAGHLARVEDVSLTGARLVPHEAHDLGRGDPVLLRVDRDRLGIPELTATVTSVESRSAGTPAVHLDFDTGQIEQRAIVTAGLFGVDTGANPHLAPAARTEEDEPVPARDG